MTKAGWTAAAILIAGWLAMLAITAPGFLTWDSVSQLASARSGRYNSWHPPVMAWLLGVFDTVVPGTLLFLVFQSGLLLAALLALLLSAPRNWFSAVLALVIVALPQWLLFQGEIWKDILFTNSAIAGFAALAMLAQRWRLAWLIAALVLLTLAASTRQNGLVLLPVAAVTLGLIARCHGKAAAWAHGAGFLVATVLLGGAANWALAARGDGGEGARAQLQTGQAYDLGGALARRPDLSLPELRGMPALDHALRQASAFYSPLRVDPVAASPVFHAALENAPPGAIAAAWRGLILHHPALYLSVRWNDFLAVLLTPDDTACHYAPVGTDGDPALLKQLGLTPGIRPRDRALARYARHFFGTPVYMHLVWAILTLLLLVLLLRQRAPPDLAMAGLLTGALLFTMTFAIISIACDYRYLLLLDMSAIAAAVYLAGTKLHTEVTNI